METSFPILSLYVFAPVLGMLAVFCIPSKRDDIIKTVASAAAAVPLIIGIYLFCVFRDDGTIKLYESARWITGLNVYYKLGMDGISAPMVVLSGLVGFVSVVASWGIDKQVKGYFALILMLLAGMNGVFCALDFFLFYVFWEVMLLPMYFLIGIWGGPNRIYAAIKFFLYTMAGSVLMLVVLLASYYWSDGSFSSADAVINAKHATYQRYEPLIRRIATEEKSQGGQMTEGELQKLMLQHQLDYNGKDTLREHLAQFQKVAATRNDSEYQAALQNLTLERTFDLQMLKTRFTLFLGDFTLFGRNFGYATLMFLFLYIAFAIKVPVFPFHTWLPWAHVEAPTAISVILAGILLKMGVYGFFRIAYPLYPSAAVYFAVPIALFGVFNIIYGACCAMAQDDLKKIVAYSSVSHMGYCMLGIAALTTFGMTGSVLQMFNHGTSTSMMFLLVGVIYDRAHHRDVNRFGGLAAILPVYTALMTVALFASMGLPGLSGFISEILVFLGAFNSDIGFNDAGMMKISFQSLTIISAVGVVLTAAYLLWMMQRVFFGPLNEKYKGYADVTGRELFTLVPLVIVVILFGVYPQPLLNLTENTIIATRKHILDGAEDAEKIAKGEGGETALRRPVHPEDKALAAVPAVLPETPLAVAVKDEKILEPRINADARR